MRRENFERVGGLARPMSAGEGDSECPAWQDEPWLHYVYRLAQHLGHAPPGPNPHADELVEAGVKPPPPKEVK